MSPAHPTRWVVVVPVKGGAGAKSRLADGSLVRDPGPLARAMAEDTLAALEAVTGPIIVVTADPEVGRWARARGASVADDPGSGLNAAVAAGVAAAHLLAPELPVAVVLGDHPAATTETLGAVLAVAAGERTAYVPDLPGTGTALLTAAPGVTPETAFGPGSAAAHDALGHVRLDAAPGVRLDVDTTADLRAALALGVGPRTRLALGTSLLGMQASVHTFDNGAGSALLDDGRVVEIPAAAFAGSGLRHLRVGQRISLTVDDAEPLQATRVWMVGIGPDERVG